ncbi:hypothetical protein BDY24DRAFT_387593 [Mrakia frigida]|uniref:uncharacterized protein n=1 Tax=Mrakia frigida TaxID=29902 RepID=UPI003FCC21DD
MRGRNVEPLRLDRLQLGRTPGIEAIFPFLDPLELDIGRKQSWEAQFASLDLLPEGSRRRTRTVMLSVRIPFATRPLSLPPSPSSSFSHVTSVAMVLQISPSVDRNLLEGEEVVLWILRFFPSLERLRIVVAQESMKKALASLFKNGYGGKGEDFFTVVIGVPLKEVAFREPSGA